MVGGNFRFAPRRAELGEERDRADVGPLSEGAERARKIKMGTVAIREIWLRLAGESPGNSVPAARSRVGVPQRGGPMAKGRECFGVESVGAGGAKKTDTVASAGGKGASVASGAAAHDGGDVS